MFTLYVALGSLTLTCLGLSSPVVGIRDVQRELEVAKQRRTLSAIPCGVIGDAGSSGTRLYLFHGNKATVKGHDHIQGGVASIGVKATMPKLGPVLMSILSEYRDFCGTDEKPPVSILGTAGTRLLPPRERNQMWSQFKNAVAGMNSFEVGEFRTLSGTEEGLFALLGANFLAGGLDHSLKPTGNGLVGIMDLGGASTQIAFPIKVPSTSVTKKDFFIESYLGYGVNELKAALVKKHGLEKVNQACLYSAVVPHPCDAFLTTAFYQLNPDCQTKPVVCAAEGRPIPTKNPKVSSMSTIYMMSGYIYTAKFAAWLDPTIDLSLPASLNDIRNWADKVCRQNYDTLKAKYREAEPSTVKHTSESQFDERCLHMKYIVVLLRAYGFQEVDRKLFHFADTINGEEVDWPLGAYLYQTEHGHLPDTPISQPPSPWIIYIMVAAMIWFAWSRRAMFRKKVKTSYEDVASDIPIGNGDFDV